MVLNFTLRLLFWVLWLVGPGLGLENGKAAEQQGSEQNAAQRLVLNCKSRLRFLPVDTMRPGNMGQIFLLHSWRADDALLWRIPPLPTTKPWPLA